MVRLDHVRRITLGQGGEWYRVLVEHDTGAEDFEWTSKQLEDMRRLADGISALSERAKD